jgi:hypothetical protein
MKPLALVVLIVGTLSCAAETPAARNRRVSSNIERLVAHQRKQLGIVDRARFGVVGAFPEGKPWEAPVAAVNSLGLVPAPDGKFYEQYEVVVDPVGVKGRSTGTYKIGPDGQLTPSGTESFETMPGWCDVLATGKLGATGRVVRIGRRLELTEQGIVERSLPERPLSP